VEKKTCQRPSLFGCPLPSNRVALKIGTASEERRGKTLFSPVVSPPPRPGKQSNVMYGDTKDVDGFPRRPSEPIFFCTRTTGRFHRTTYFHTRIPIETSRHGGNPIAFFFLSLSVYTRACVRHIDLSERVVPFRFCRFVVFKDTFAYYYRVYVREKRSLAAE